MSNIVEALIAKAVESAGTNPYVAGGMVAGGAIIVIGKWIWDKRKDTQQKPKR